jgi:ribose transport system permease protein
MNHRRLRQGLQFALRHISLILFAVVLVAFALLSDRFLSVRNLTNIVIQAAHVGILGIGMTFVLLTAGIDLSVGAVMYLGAATLGTYFIGLPLWLGLLAVCGVGMAFGAANAIVITRLGVAAFITTLATLFIGRGLALFVTGTQVVVLPQEILQFGRTTLLGVSWSVWAFGAVLAISWFVLTQTTFGRQVYAVGADLDAAGKAGIKVGRVLFLVYVICGLLAAIAGLVSASQVGTVSPTFALQKEFAAVAAAVLGGTSLFGGRGSVLGTVFGAILIQTVANGLVIINADPYIYPVVVAAIIFLAVLADSLRTNFLERTNQRQIRLEDSLELS